MNDNIEEPLAPWEVWLLGSPVDPKDVHIVYNPGQSGAAAYYKDVRVEVGDTEDVRERVLDMLGVKATYDVDLTPPGGSGSWHEVPNRLPDLVPVESTEADYGGDEPGPDQGQKCYSCGQYEVILITHTAGGVLTRHKVCRNCDDGVCVFC